MKLSNVSMYINIFLFIIAAGASTSSAFAQRSNIPGAIRFTQGLQMDESCAQMAKKLGKEPNFLKEKIQKMLDSAEEMVTKKCSKRYKELTKYTSQWKKQLQTSVMLCGGNGLTTVNDQKKYKACADKYAEKNDKKINCQQFSKAAGMAYPFKSSIADELPSHKLGQLIGNVDSSKPMAAQEKGIFGLSEYTINQILEGETSGALKTITHELFHLTEANNRHDHNEIETETFDEEEYYDVGSTTHHNFCGNNVTKDRIVLITGLCLDSEISGSYGIKVPEAISIIRSQCGKERACTDIFAHSKTESIPGWSSGVSDVDASNLCQKVFFEGTCQKFFKMENGDKVFLNLQPIKILADKAIERFETFLPSSEHEIPKKLMEELLKGTDTSVEDLKKNKCLSQILINSKTDGNWYLAPHVTKKYDVKGTKYQTSKDRWGAAVILDNYAWALNYAQKAMEEHPFCQSEKDDHFFQNLFEKMKANSKKIFRPHLVMDLMRRAAFQTVEEESKVDLTSDYSSSKENNDFVELMGKDIMMPYLEARAIYHPKAPHFDCTTSPVRDNAAFFSYRNFIFELQKSFPPKISCPP